jgi:[acyl-carrier-protein] S-malonyltransferase
MMTFAFVFPGQGSQVVGMGREIYDASPIAREVFQEIDDVLGQKLSKIMFEGPQEALTLTANAQPALMAVSMALVRVMQKEAGINIPSQVSFLAGHSLGEYTALCAGGAFTLSNTARLLRTRGNAMQSAIPVGEGAMAAVLGLEIDQVSEICTEATQEKSVCVIANDNSPGQVVISGHKDAVARALELAREAGAKRSILLDVSAPFHSPLMQPAALIMQDALANVEGISPFVPVISNVRAAPEGEFGTLRDLLVEQVTGQVRWRESILKMCDLGVTTFVEIGSGKVLTGLLKRINPEAKGVSIGTLNDIEEFLKTV